MVFYLPAKKRAVSHQKLHVIHSITRNSRHPLASTGFNLSNPLLLSPSKCGQMSTFGILQHCILGALHGFALQAILAHTISPISSPLQHLLDARRIRGNGDVQKETTASLQTVQEGEDAIDLLGDAIDLEN